MFGQMYRALAAAGSTAFVTITAEVSLGELNTTIPLTELDGTIVGLMSWDTDTPNPVCKQVVDYYAKKYGKWDDPSFDIDTFYAFKAALEKAGSADTTAMAEALGTGLAFDGPHGASKMIPRADAGVADRTVCLIMEYADCHPHGRQSHQLQVRLARRIRELRPDLLGHQEVARQAGDPIVVVCPWGPRGPQGRPSLDRG